MERRPARQRQVLRWVIFLLLALLPMAAGAAQHPIATVIAERGTLLIQPGGFGPFLVMRNQRLLSAGDIVRTGPDGEAAILFDDGSQVKLRANASLKILPERRERPDQSLFQALLGVIWAHLRPGQTIHTPTANIVVRGTEVLLAVAPDGTTTLTVTQGRVTFFNPQGTVDVAVDQQSIARPGQAPTPPAAVDVSGLLAWTAEVAGLPLEFEVPGLTPAVQAQSAYAADAARLTAATRQASADPAAVWIGLGNARRGLGDLTGALDAFGEAARVAPSNSAEALAARVGSALTLLTQGKTPEARAVLEPVGGEAAALAVLGLTDLHDGNAAGAAAHLQAALARDPALYAARALLALAFLTQNDLPEAEAAARAAAAAQPDSAQTEGTLAMTLFFAEKSPEAQAAARRAVHADPRSPFALLTEGRTLLARQQIDAARADYEKAAAVAPYLWLVHEELGAVYLRLDMPPKAAEEYRLALTLNPNSADALSGLGVADQRQGRYADAEQKMRQAVRTDPANVTAHYNLAALLIDRGRLSEAQQELETGVRSAPDRGILYARLAEIRLYQQDLFGAQEFALHAVRLLPDSAVAHYVLGRVYLEQERTVQAEQEFRQATTLDRSFAEARYALGVTEQKTEGGLLNSFSSLLGSALVGSPGSTLSLENLQTPGAEQRIQAALLDPTVVRVASRSYGDTQLDATYGERGTRDLAGSFLTDTGDRRGVGGVTGEEQATNGVRADAGEKTDTASFVFGRKAVDNPSAIFVTGDYEDLSQGVDDGVAPDPYAATLRFHSHLSRLIAGVNSQVGDRSRFRALFQISRYLYGNNDSTSAVDFDHTDIHSVDGEFRWDTRLSKGSLLSAGFALGSRKRQVNAESSNPDPTMMPFFIVGSTKIQPYQAYLRDESRLSTRLTLIAEMQVQRLDIHENLAFIGLDGIPSTQEDRSKTLGLPNVIVSYQPDARSGLRVRFRRLLASVSDFQLLAPTDVFLFSFADLPQALSLDVPTSDGTSAEIEYDHTFSDASFLRLGAFQQDIRQSLIAGVSGGPYAKSHLRSLRGGYEGLLNRRLSFFLSGDLNSAYDSDTSLRIAQVPNFETLLTLQYLDRAGFYTQTAYYYQGNRVAADDDRSHLGGFGVLNFRLGKRFGLRSDIFLELRNALNKRYDLYGVLQPSRQVAVGLSQRF